MRKFSVETVIGGTEERFCLRSETSTKNDLAKSFMSSLKILNMYGPESANYPRTKTLSPSMSSLTIKSKPDEEATLPSAPDVALKYSVSAESLTGMDLVDVEAIPGISDTEVQVLTDWRDDLVYEKRSGDVLQLMDDYPLQDNFFKKN